MTKREQLLIRRNIDRLASLGLRVLRDCDNGRFAVKEQYGGVRDIVAEFSTAEELDRYLISE